MLLSNVPRMLVYLCTQRFRLAFGLEARSLLLVDRQSNSGCLHSIVNVAGVLLFSCIYVHINFVSQIFRWIRMGVATIIGHLVLMLTSFAVLLKSGK